MTTLPSPSRIPLWKTLVPALVIVLAVAMGFVLLRKATDQGEMGQAGAPVVGSELRDASFIEFPQRELKLSDLQYKVLVVNFWASWCEACVTEMPSIIRLWSQHKDRGLKVAFVNVDEDPQAVIPKFVEELKIPFEMYADKDGQLSDLFDVTAIPLTVVIGPGRKVLHIETGERNWNDAEVNQWMDGWLSQ